MQSKARNAALQQYAPGVVWPQASLSSPQYELIAEKLGFSAN
jgi:hypothetical protein